MDTVTKAKRSWIMGRIRSKGTRPELALAGALRRTRVPGWRRQRRVLGISLDFAWPAEKVALRVMGCFWHNHQPHARLPQTRRRWWARKIAGNVERDARQAAELRAAGWIVVDVWECWISSLGAGVAARIARSVVEPRRTA